MKIKMKGYSLASKKRVKVDWIYKRIFLSFKLNIYFLLTRENRYLQDFSRKLQKHQEFYQTPFIKFAKEKSLELKNKRINLKLELDEAKHLSGISNIQDIESGQCELIRSYQKLENFYKTRI